MSECKDYIDHFPSGTSPAIEKYATNDVLRESRYIFTHREGKQQYGYCTHCGQEFRTERFAHNTKEQCPKCDSVCTVKSSGRGHSKMVDEAYLCTMRNPRKILMQ